jgi:hypothetical protein
LPFISQKNARGADFLALARYLLSRHLDIARNYLYSFDRPGTTPGERRFGSRLRDLLEEDYLCWHNVPVGPLRQNPDFILLHPTRGLLIFEVKDGKLDTLRAISKQSVEIITPEGSIKTLPNPLDQARDYCMNVVNLLSTDPQLQDPNARYRGKICFPYGHTVALTNIKRWQSDEVLSRRQQCLRRDCLERPVRDIQKAGLPNSVRRFCGNAPHIGGSQSLLDAVFVHTRYESPIDEFVPGDFAAATDARPLLGSGYGWSFELKIRNPSK